MNEAIFAAAARNRRYCAERCSDMLKKLQTLHRTFGEILSKFHNLTSIYNDGNRSRAKRKRASTGKCDDARWNWQPANRMRAIRGTNLLRNLHQMTHPRTKRTWRNCCRHPLWKEGLLQKCLGIGISSKLSTGTTTTSSKAIFGSHRKPSVG